MPAQESTNRAKRLLTLRQLIVSQPGRKWRTKELASRLNVSEDTVSRDLRDMSGDGTLPLISSGSTANFTWELSPDYRPPLEPLHLDYADGAALYAAARLLWQQQDERNDTVRDALLQLISILPKPLNMHLEAMVEGAAPQIAGQDATAIFKALSGGWLGGRIVELTYEPPNRPQYTRRFAPYLLEPSGIGHTVYFIGHSDPPGALRTYKLERIRAATLTNDSFTIPSDFGGVARLQNAWGINYGEGDPIEVRLRFTNTVSRRVRETTWHASQRIADLPDGGCLFTVQIGSALELKPWIRQWGPDVEVLTPQSLRDEIADEARATARIYGE
ncbi:MAG: helix-turn-helix transcriptional regulator [Ktedonobacterales bacterium]